MRRQHESTGEWLEMQPDVEEFLRESNAIEGVYDEDYLQQALYAWHYLAGKKELTVGVILQTHKMLMLHQPLAPDEKGYFRKVPVWIGGREGINAIRIPEVMEQWVVNANDLVLAKEVPSFQERMIINHHIEYERIHPFVDGNGRTGRLFMNWQRMKLGMPILTIHAGEEQKEYYQWFK